MTTTKIIKIIPGEEGTETHVAEISTGFSVTIWDTEVNQPLPMALIYKTAEEAIAKAVEITA